MGRTTARTTTDRRLDLLEARLDRALKAMTVIAEKVAALDELGDHLDLAVAAIGARLEFTMRKIHVDRSVGSAFEVTQRRVKQSLWEYYLDEVQAQVDAAATEQGAPTTAEVVAAEGATADAAAAD